MYAHTQTFHPKNHGRSMVHRRNGSHLRPTRGPLLSLRTGVCHPCTRIYVRLLGPCFKTGERKPFRQDPDPACPKRQPEARGCPRSTPQQRCRGITATPKGGPPPPHPIPAAQTHLDQRARTTTVQRPAGKYERITLASFPSLSAISGTL